MFPATTAIPNKGRELFDELVPGDRVEVSHLVTVGLASGRPRPSAPWCGPTHRHGLHFRRNFDDKVFSDLILLRLPDGELTSVTLDEFTTLRRA